MKIFIFIFILQCFSFEDYIWVISDTHFDSKFAEGGYAHCKSIDCCHEDSVPKGNNFETAQFCGHHSCHAPLETIMSGMDFIKSHESISKNVIWLMDVIPSDMFQMTKQRNLNDLEMFHNELKRRLPGFTVLPSIGNHDYFETSFWAFPPKSQWMLNNMSLWWKDWLSPEEIATTKKGGYYIHQLPSGINIISLQTAYFDIMNSHSGEYPKTDPGEMMMWFNATLKVLREKGQKAIIISHESIGLKITGMMDVNPYFTRDFLELYKEYSDVIIGHLAGHNHIEGYRLYPGEDPFYSVIINPAMTPKGSNPSLRLYKFNDKHIIDYTTYYLNLDQCNAEHKYTWVKSYNTQEEYGLVNLGNSEIGRLHYMLKNDNIAWSKFMKHFSTELPNSCEGNCRKQRLCSMENMRESGYAECIKK
ncbi:sphingomyelin phosphodiesterase, putative [Entamoeba dispar SAW760]|uniref:Sphingomyelin phosphodiesterase, putative n=1 Tax=Entamoeba dispar (strain ATCC PRA-260 / SAW760) TaxID=370354 RepID=B0ETK5_ENTDS|nr:sphingomyelin phosphodiesterase, putative [Entamoeba dispar SAW760]EDR22190.1 sphingomyelin phosphodiesterase, putative [Entamoeba dispar SAW760]|eukprot:EDR22190.1 sphingomyelin phosphodiesterase, putative [Entamoeba dispar SAW760]